MEEEKPETPNTTTPIEHTPLPKVSIFVIYLINLIDRLSVVSLFPYISQLTIDLLNLDEKKDAKLVGYYSGFIASSYFVTQLFSAPIWGWISDRYGRRKVLLIGTLGTAISCLLFGFSKYYWWALLTRGLFGALNGNLGVAKTYLREITDETNQSRAFSFLPIAFSTSLLRFILSFFFLKETLNSSNEKENDKEIVEDEVKTNVENAQSEEVEMSDAMAEDVNIIEEEVDRIDTLNAQEEIEPINEKIEDVILLDNSGHTADGKIPKFLKDKCLNIFKSNIFSRSAIISVALYGFLGLTQIMYAEVFPIWIWTPSDHQGLGLEPYKIGIIQGSMGIFVILSQLFFVHRFIDKVGMMKSYQIATILAIPPLLGLPEVYRIAQLKNYEWLVWLLVFIQAVWKQIWTSVMFTCTMLLVNNSVPKKDLGTLNGIAQSFVALTRAVGPSIATPIFAFSISNNLPFPLDVHLVFYLTAIISFMVFPLTFFFPKSKV